VLQAMVPQEHRDFAASCWRPRRARAARGRGRHDARAARLDRGHAHAARSRSRCAPEGALIANALGTPPVDVIDDPRQGRLVARCAARQAGARKHKEAGVDIVIAQGGEGGGHTGEVGSIVLWPQVIDAVAPTPVLAAGGIGSGRQIAAALAMGAQGVWTGSLWLTVEEAENAAGQKESLLDATSERHGPLALVDRQAVPHAPQRLDRGLGAPRQPEAARHAAAVHGHGRRVAAPTATPTRRSDVAFNPVGQVVGQNPPSNSR
jgi:NAD(P)H-dependent flavin oxidoreductase YrpB (nitropropane dioxygenase family)